MTIGIYKITNLVNNKVYIGQSTNIQKRIKDHIYNVNTENKYPIYEAIRRYGINNFKFEIILTCNIEDLDELETYYTKKYKSNNITYGYNCTNGGKNCKFNENTIKKMSECKMGIKNPMYGKTPNPETLKKRSESLKKVEHTKEWHAKIGAKHKGKILSDETKEKIRQKLLGNKLSDETKTKMSKSQKGRKHSEATKEKLRKPKKIQTIYQYDLQNNLINTFNSLHEASNISGINNAQILAVCKNYKWKKTAGGYKWSYNKL